MKKFSIIILLAAICAFFTLPALAQSENAGGSPAMSFSAVNPDPVLMGMGGAGLATANSPAWASFGNVSSLAFSESVLSLSGGYRRWAPGKDNCPEGGVSLRLGKALWLTVGGGFQNGEGVIEYSADGNKIDESTPSSIRANFGAAYAISDKLSIGAGVHYLHSSVASNADYNTASFDLNAFMRIAGVNVSAGARNIGLPVKDKNNQKYMIPGEFFAAASYPLALGGDSKFNFAADAAAYLSSGFAFSTGAEYSFKNMLFARVGGRISNAALPSLMSAGVGFKFKGLSLDAAYVALPSSLGGSFCAALDYSF
ncbi:MAG: hypothetical protein II616_01185 [Bacteroidales bacterium]|nr:hypothetical protein [Bacteroidales bacterium]